MFSLNFKRVEIVRNEFEKYFSDYEVVQKEIDYFTRIYILNDSLVILSEIIEDTSSRPLSLKNDTTKYYLFYVEELTFNELGFKFNNSKFIRDLKIKFETDDYLELDISYTKFRGYTRLYWCQDVETTAEKFNREFPELHLRERYENWKGQRYYFIVMDFEDNFSGIIIHAVSYTTQLPHHYIIDFGKEFIRRGHFRNRESIRFNYSEIENFIKSWRGTRRQEILEKHFKYFCIEKYFREKNDVWRYADIILEKANSGEYDNFEKATYLRPIKKWISEELVFKITKKLFKDHKVIYQHRPFFLKSSKGGQMSYDIFISGLNIAIEYQGKQHFEPVDYFGGEKSFEDLKIRDSEKLKLSEQNGIKLIYINYLENITENLIREKIFEICKKI